MAKKLMLLINPNAGKGQYKTALADIVSEFSAADMIPSIFLSRYPGNIAEIVKEHALEYDLVVCMGGDGTFSELANGMINLPEQRPIGYIPMGTANDVARTLGLDHKQPVLSAKKIITGSEIPFDVGQFGLNKIFTYIAAFGAFTEVSYATPQESKHTLGHLAYMLEAIKQLPKITSQRAIVEFDDGVICDDFIFGAVTNSTSVAGLLRLDSDKVSLSDGMFEVLLIKAPQAIKDLNEIITSILSNNYNQNNVIFLKSREVRIMFDSPISWTRDGEDGGCHQDVYIINRHPGLRIIV